MKSFDEVYNQYAEMVYKIAFMYFGNADDSEDALQEVFMKYLYASPRFKDGGHEKAWLIRVTQNKCLDMLKSSARKNSSIDDIPLSAETADKDARLDVIAKIISLPPKYKSTILLYYYYDYSVSNIAHTLKISNSAVKMRLKRGREILKIELEDYNEKK